MEQYGPKTEKYRNKVMVCGILYIVGFVMELLMNGLNVIDLVCIVLSLAISVGIKFDLVEGDKLALLGIGIGILPILGFFGLEMFVGNIVLFLTGLFLFINSISLFT